MKKLLLSALLFGMFSCEQITDIVKPAAPDAVLSLEVKPRGTVHGKNLSTNFETATIDWGDGSTYEGLVISDHTYAKDGVYEVKLTVKSKNGKTSDVATKRITIDNTEGDFMVYLGRKINDTSIMMSIDGKSIGSFNYYSTFDGVLNCSSTIKDYGTKVHLKPGKHTFAAITLPAVNSVWEFEFTVENNQCIVKKLI